MEKRFEFKQAELLNTAMKNNGVRYLFIGKGAAIMLGYSDATQDVDIFVDKTPENNERVLAALTQMGFQVSKEMEAEIKRGKDFVQLRNGPFDIDLIFAPDGIESFSAAWKKHVDVEGFPVCSIEDIIKSKKAANRQKDRESISRLEEFKNYLSEKGKKHLKNEEEGNGIAP